MKRILNRVVILLTLVIVITLAGSKTKVSAMDSQMFQNLLEIKLEKVQKDIITDSHKFTFEFNNKHSRSYEFYMLNNPYMIIQTTTKSVRYDFKSLADFNKQDAQSFKIIPGKSNYVFTAEIDGDIRGISFYNLVVNDSKGFPERNGDHTILSVGIAADVSQYVKKTFSLSKNGMILIGVIITIVLIIGYKSMKKKNSRVKRNRYRSNFSIAKVFYVLSAIGFIIPIIIIALAMIKGYFPPLELAMFAIAMTPINHLSSKSLKKRRRYNSRSYNNNQNHSSYNHQNLLDENQRNTNEQQRIFDENNRRFMENQNDQFTREQHSNTHNDLHNINNHNDHNTPFNF